MNDHVILEDVILPNGTRRLHVMSNTDPHDGIHNMFGEMAGEQATVTQEMGVWHIRAEYRYQGVLDVHAEGWPKFRRLVVWPITETMRFAIYDAAKEFMRLFGRWPGFAFTKKLPRGIENGIEVGTVSLFEAEWALGNSVMVGGDASLALGMMPREDAVDLVSQMMRDTK